MGGRFIARTAPENSRCRRELFALYVTESRLTEAFRVTGACHCGKHGVSATHIPICCFHPSLRVVVSVTKLPQKLKRTLKIVTQRTHKAWGPTVRHAVVGTLESSNSALLLTMWTLCDHMREIRARGRTCECFLYISHSSIMISILRAMKEQRKEYTIHMWRT